MQKFSAFFVLRVDDLFDKQADGRACVRENAKRYELTCNQHKYYRSRDITAYRNPESDSCSENSVTIVKLKDREGIRNDVYYRLQKSGSAVTDDSGHV